MNSEHWISHGMANPLIESFGESPKACVTNSSCPPANLKGKENPDLPSVCSNYYTGLLTWLSVCVLNHLVLSTFRQCRSAIPQRSAKPITSIHRTVWPNSLVRRPPWLHASSVKNKKIPHTVPLDKSLV